MNDVSRVLTAVVIGVLGFGWFCIGLLDPLLPSVGPVRVADLLLFCGLPACLLATASTITKQRTLRTVLRLLLAMVVIFGLAMVSLDLAIHLKR